VTTRLSPRVYLPRNAGFTLIEAVVAIALIGITITAFTMTMSSLNQSASVTRNATGASTALQNQIDLILSDGPFNPQKVNSDGTPQIPPELTLGTHVLTDVPIYREPTSGIVVAGTLTTTVTDMSAVLNGITLPIYRADVRVTYTYRNKSYSFARSTLRASDI
jgi:prepilin-type N-terminal cleavage/methylation domain-containing protein